MTNFAMNIRMINSEGVLERVLGKLRQRNFNVVSLNACCSSDMSTIEAHVTLNSLHSSESAIKQLNKLYDIQQIQLLPTAENHRFKTTENHINLGEQNEVCLSV
jgi:acetolactate synthase regulatory subunit